MHRGDANAGENSSCTVEVTKVYCIMSKVIWSEASKTGFMNKNYSVYFQWYKMTLGNSTSYVESEWSTLLGGILWFKV